ncbi:DUF4190 domain-containing protein [Rossellomorea marisflavi]|uniref:DUF4190 domain-containing protein n=1 Tax=Rossellomorea marisflavi TaxID=189381 RepID=UPI00116B1BE0
MMPETHTVIIEKPEGNGLAVSALVLGIIGLVLFLIPFLPYPLAIMAIVFGVIGRKKQVKKGLALTGIITGIITLVLKVWFWVGLVSMM